MIISNPYDFILPFYLQFNIYSTRSDGGGGSSGSESKPKSVVSLLRVVSRYIQNKNYSASRGTTDHGEDKTWSTLVNCFKR